MFRPQSRPAATSLTSSLKRLDTALDFVDGVVDDGVESDFDFLFLGQAAGIGRRPYLEADDDGVGGGGQQDVGLGDGSHCLVDHVHVNLFGGELDEGVGQGLDGAVHVSLDDDVELLEVAYRDAAADLLEGDVLLGPQALDAEQLLALVGQVLGLALVLNMALTLP